MPLDKVLTNMVKRSQQTIQRGGIAVIFLVGPHCAGKTRILAMFSRAAFSCVDLGPLLREIHQRASPQVTFADWIRMGETTHGRSFTDAQLAQAISREVGCAVTKRHQDLVIAGSRSLEGIRYLVERIGSYQGRANVIIWVEAPIEILCQRYNARNPDRPLSYPDFLRFLEDDNRLGLSGLKDVADLRLSNAGSEQELQASVHGLIRRLGYTDVGYV